MKQGIHPSTYGDIKVSCNSCGHSFPLATAVDKNLTVDVCYKCHPFYTGKQKIIDSSGAVDKFNKRYGSFMGQPKKDEDK